MRGTTRIESGSASCSAVLHRCLAAARIRREVVNLICGTVVLPIGAMEVEGLPLPEPRPTPDGIEVVA